MSKFLRYEACPRCRSKGNDNRGNNLAIYSDDGAHCFACHYHIFPKHYVKPEKEKVIGPEGLLPADFTREVPSRAWEWLLQWGLPYTYWQDRIGWSEKDSRLVFTEDNFSIGRLVSDVALPTKHNRKWFVWGNCHKTPIVLGDYRESKEVVLVEDLISAHKVSQAGFTAICLYGTRVFDSVYPCLRHIGLPTCLWLDKDQEASMPKKAAQVAQLSGRACRYVVTDDDPKALTFVKIKEILS